MSGKAKSQQLGLSRVAANHTGRTASRYLLSGLLRCSECGSVYTIANATHYACSTYVNGGSSGCSNSARLHRVKAEEGVMEGIQRVYLQPQVLEEAQRRARALIKARTAKHEPDARAPRIRTLREEIANLTDAIARGALRSSPAIAERLRAAEEGLAALEAQPTRPPADVELLIPRLLEEIRAGVEALPKRLAEGNVDLARQELKGYLGAVRVVAEPTRMLLYSEKNAAEAVIARAGGSMGSFVGSGGRLQPETLSASVCLIRAA